MRSAQAKTNTGWYKMRGQSWRDHGSSRFITVFSKNVIILSGKKTIRTICHDFELHIWPRSTRLRIFETMGKFRQMSPKSSVNGDVAVFWLHCYFWSICRHRFSGIEQGGRHDLPWWTWNRRYNTKCTRHIQTLKTCFNLDISWKTTVCSNRWKLQVYAFQLRGLRKILGFSTIFGNWSNTNEYVLQKANGETGHTPGTPS